MVLLRTVLLVGVSALALAAMAIAAEGDSVSSAIAACQAQYDQGLYSETMAGLADLESKYAGKLSSSDQSAIDALESKAEQGLNDQMNALFKDSIKAFNENDLAAAERGFLTVKQSGVNAKTFLGKDSDFYLRLIAVKKELVGDAPVVVPAAPDAEEPVAGDADGAAEAAATAEKTALEAKQAEAKSIFDEAIKLFAAGNLDEAQKGFEAVKQSGIEVKTFWGKDSDYYLARIADKRAVAARVEEEAKIAAEKAAAEKAAAEKAAAEKAVAEEARAERIAAEKAEAEKLAAEKLAAEKLAAEKAAAEKAAAAKAEAEKLAAEKAAAEKAAAVKAAAEAQAEALKLAEEAVKAQAAPEAEATTPVVEDIDITAVVAEQKTTPEAAEDSYLKVLAEKRDRQRDYTRAIFNDSLTKAQTYLAASDYAQARGALAVAYANIEKTKLLLGDELYGEYKANLDEFSANIDSQENQASIESAKIKRRETEQLEEDIRLNMERQRQQAVKDYMANAMAFQREQRYREALAQLDALLAIDPLNSMALLQKQTLEQTIVWREQIDVQKQIHEQEIQTLLNADRASVPYADDMTFPSNWKEIVAKRSAASGEDMSKEDLAVYRLLEQVVDLSAFYEDMPFGEAIEVLANSTNPPLTIVVLWRDLDENAFVDQTTPINLIIPAPVKVKTGLELLLNSVAGGLAELGYVVKDGIIQIATVESLPDKMVTNRYDVRELLGQQANFSFQMDAQNYSQEEARQPGGGGGGGGNNYQDDDQNEQFNDPQTMMSMAASRADAIVTLVQESIDPMSWYDAGGDATISIFQNNVLVIRQTIENQKKIKTLLDELRSTLSEQVAIETRFITVTENFLEEIGIDMQMVISPQDTNWNDIAFTQTHGDTKATDNGVPGSLAGTIASDLSGSYVMDDLQVSFLIEATQAHSDTKTLNAPKVAVLNGERASIRVGQQISFVSDYDFETITGATGGGETSLVTSIADPQIDTIRDGVSLTVSPIITSDKKYVILGIETNYFKSSFDTYAVPSDADGAQGATYNIQLPVRSETSIGTRVTVPDGGTLLIGGQKLTGENTQERGVPILSKVPFFGPLFETRGNAKDHHVLLILVKPTIILRDEQEKEAVDAMSSGL
jgi:Flp pilus assembly secretin CpaC